MQTVTERFIKTTEMMGSKFIAILFPLNDDSLFTPFRLYLMRRVPTVLWVFHTHETAFGSRTHYAPSLAPSDKTAGFLLLFLLTLASASSSLFQKEKEHPKITV